MKEKIFGILYELIFADNLATTWKIKCHKASTNIDSLVNQEVEKRIAERMRGVARYDLDEFDDGVMMTPTREGVYVLYTDIRSRLTNPGVNDSQKTEQTHQDAPQVPLKMEGSKGPSCPKCGSKFIMEHQYDDRYKICMNCKHNWKE